MKCFSQVASFPHWLLHKLAVYIYSGGIFKIAVRLAGLKCYSPNKLNLLGSERDVAQR